LPKTIRPCGGAIEFVSTIPVTPNRDGEFACRGRSFGPVVASITSSMIMRRAGNYFARLRFIFSSSASSWIGVHRPAVVQLAPLGVAAL